jgi:hypothetical protein
MLYNNNQKKSHQTWKNHMTSEVKQGLNSILSVVFHSSVNQVEDKHASSDTIPDDWEQFLRTFYLDVYFFIMR